MYPNEAADIVHYSLQILYDDEKSMPIIVTTTGRKKNDGNDQRLFEQIWRELCQLCGSETASGKAWLLFQKVMRVAHDSIDDFDNALFEALAKALGQDCCYMDDTQETILFKSQNNWGFA